MGKIHRIFLLLLFFILLTVPHMAPALTPGDEVLQKIGVDEKVNSVVPLDLTFTNQDGSHVRLGDYFTGQPVILSLNFYECPMLCPLVMRNLAESVAQMQGISLNRDFRIVTVSFNAEETPATTKEKALETYQMLRGVTDPEHRWPFLMGDATAIERLTTSVGFKYVRLGKNNFAHPAVLIMLTPEGRIARYLYGIEQKPRDLKLALVEAADGKIGGSQLINRALLYCFHYDPVGKKYAIAAINIMKIVGGAVLLFLLVLVSSLWRHEKLTNEEKGGA